ncbi:hypothetical protein [Bacillus sp. AK128]
MSIMNSRFLILKTSTYYTLIIFQVVLLFNLKSDRVKRIIILNIILLLLIPTLLFSTLPPYNYEKGKDLIEEELKGMEYAFIPIKNKIVPTTKILKYKSIVLTNDYFYYKVEVNGKEYFYSVSPFDGSVFELERDFFSP